MVQNLPFSFWGVTCPPDFPVPATGPSEARLETSEPCFPLSCIPEAIVVPVPSKTCGPVFLFLSHRDGSGTHMEGRSTGFFTGVCPFVAGTGDLRYGCALSSGCWGPGEVGAEHTELLDRLSAATQWLCQ